MLGREAFQEAAVANGEFSHRESCSKLNLLSGQIRGIKRDRDQTLGFSEAVIFLTCTHC